MVRIILLVFVFISPISYGKSETVVPVFQTGHYSRITQIEFHKDNQHLVSAADDGRLIVWDIYLGLQFQSTLVDQSGIKNVAFLTDSTLITLTNNDIIQQWSFPELKAISPPISPIHPITDVTVINDSTVGLTGKQVYLYNLKQQVLTCLDYTSNAYFSTIAYQKERNEIAVSGPVDNYCATISLDSPYQYKRYVLGNINQAKYTGSNQLILSETSGSLVSIDLNTGKKKVYNLKDNHNYVHAVDASNGKIAIASTHGFAQIISSDDQKIITTIGLNGVALSAIKYSPDQKWLAIGNHNGTITLYETEHYKLNRILKGASASVTDIQIFGNNLFVGYSDGIIRQLDLLDHKIMSNSIKRAPFEEKMGIDYSILSIDTLVDDQLKFTVLKTDRHHEKSHLLRAANKYESVWDLETNEILLKKEIEDIPLRFQVDHNYRMNTTFQLRHYLEEPFSYSFDSARYQYQRESRGFIRIKNDDTLHYPVQHEAPIEGLRFIEDYGLILSFSTDGSIRFWDKKGNYKATLYLSGQYGYTYWSPSNFYFSTKEMLSKIGFIYNQKLYSYEQFDVYYNRPNEVMKNIPYFSEEDVSDYQKAYYKRLEKLGLSESRLIVSEDLPQLNVDYKGGYSTRSDRAKFTLNLFGNERKIVRYSYRINGIEHYTSVDTPSTRFSTEVTIELAAGLNQVEFYCEDEGGVKSLVKKVNITCEKNFAKPELYLVSIGVSTYADSKYELVYPQKDASEISELMKKNKQFKTVHEKTILNSDFTSQKLDDLKGFLADARINDVILFYYAGHGVLNSDFDYYLSTYDMNFNLPEEKGIAFDEIEAYFESLACRNKLIILDACFSGEIDKSAIDVNGTKEDSEKGVIQFRKGTNMNLDGGGEMGIFELAKMTFVDLNRNNSTNILSSASGVEYAMESKDWENGLFTFVLKDALLNERADLNGDHLIRIMELQVYLRETVSSLSNGKQNPILRKENSKNNFVIW